MSKLIILAEVMGLKYKIADDESDDKRNLKDIKYNIINAFNLYVNDGDPIKNPYSIISGTTAFNKENIIPVLSTLRKPEPNSKYILTTMRNLVEDIDEITPETIYMVINRLLNRMSDKKISEILNFVKVNATKGEWGENLLTKTKTTFKRLSSILDQQYKRISNIILKKPNWENRAYEPSVAEIPFRKLRNFTLTPIAQDLGLTDVNVLSRVLENHRELVTNVINSINRGHEPKRGEELWAAIMKVQELYQEMTKYNIQELEKAPKYEANPASLFDPGTGPKAEIPLTTYKKPISLEEEKEIEEQKKINKAREQGGGVGEGSL